MKRHYEQNLDTWFKSSRRKPLVIRGARQTGKSTLVRQFAKAQELDLYEINLEQNRTLDAVFETLDLDKIILELEATLGRTLKRGKSLLFLDEIQATPHAIAALRYFYEKSPELAVVSAGSLLEFALAKHSFSMPVGRVQYLYCFPMSFTEFLEALEEQYLLDTITSFSITKRIPEAAHQKLLDLQRIFLLVGGMPEAIDVYCKTKSLADTSAVQREILSTYVDDFSKYSSGIDLARMQSIFNRLPVNIGRKVKYSSFAADLKSGQVRDVIELFSKAHVVYRVCHSDCSGLPLEAQLDSNVYKLLHLDIGLLLNRQGLDYKAIKNLDDRDLINEGVIAEQFIGQHLLAINATFRERSLLYWLREGKSGNSELDYVISRGDKIIPIEVKAGKSGNLKSLHQFMSRKSSGFAVRFDLDLPSIQEVRTKTNTSNQDMSEVTYKLISLPLYLVETIDRVIEDLR